MELPHQAAGHTGTLVDGQGLLIFKPSLDKEVSFYREVQARYVMNDALTKHILDKGDVPFHYWVPTFLGMLDSGKTNIPKNPNDSVQILKEEDILGDRDNTTKSLPINTTLNVGSSEDTLDITTPDEKKQFIVLENLLRGYVNPNIMDVKLGQILYDDDATDEKKKRLQKVSETTTSGSLSFRICGMKLQNNKSIRSLNKDKMDDDMFENVEDGYVFVNKFFGRSRTKNNIMDAFNLFFDNDNLTQNRKEQVIHMFFQRLSLLYNTLLDTEVRMVSSSLLFIYEGDVSRWDDLNDKDMIMRTSFLDEDSDDEDGDNDKEPSIPVLSSLSLIDFAHSKFTPGQGCDENVIQGVENLIELFNDL